MTQKNKHNIGKNDNDNLTNNIDKNNNDESTKRYKQD